MRLATACIFLLAMTGCYEESVKKVTDSTDSTGTVATEQNPSAEGAAGKAELASEAEFDEAAFLANALEQVKNGTALLVDVRTDKEWDDGHFEAATHIAVDKIKEDPAAAFDGIDKEQTVFLH